MKLCRINRFFLFFLFFLFSLFLLFFFKYIVYFKFSFIFSDTYLPFKIFYIDKIFQYLNIHHFCARGLNSDQFFNVDLFTLWLYVVYVYIPSRSILGYNRYLSFLAFLPIISRVISHPHSQLLRTHVPSYPHSLPILPSSDLSCEQKDTCDDSYLFPNAFRSRDRASRRTSIFRVSSRWQFSRGWWRQTTTGCADAPEMSSRGKVPRCWK